MQSNRILFELPVYLYDENKYYDKWKSTKRIFIEHQINFGSTEEEATASFLRCYKYNYLWDYNKIIGFIRICYDSNSGDLKFNIFKQNKRVIYNKINKMKFEEVYGSNLHVYVRNISNSEIMNEIDKKLKYIKNSFFNKNYIQTKTFDNVFKYLNFKKMISGFDE